MGDLSLHFDRAEFACLGRNCCGHSAPVDPRLVQGLEELRGRLLARFPGRHIAVLVTSGFRCEVHNREVGGAKDSYHRLGMAADIVVYGVDPLTVKCEASKVDVFASGGIGLYDEFVHVDVRQDGPARWS